MRFTSRTFMPIVYNRLSAMNRYVDIHAHVLYGIDDGPADRADAEAMLRTAARSGTATIAATPHLRSDFPDVQVEELAARADELRAWIADEGLEIELVNGGEVGLVWALDADDDSLRLASYGQLGSDLLIETPTTIVGIEALLYQVRTRGYRVTLAHPERSREFQRDPSVLEALVERGILLQVNADAVCGDARRSPTARLAQGLCTDGLAHALASDSHRAAEWRPVSVMPYAVAAAAELVGAQRAEWMAVDCPAAIVAGQPLPAPPPIVAPQRRRWSRAAS
jgi:protein-tyrosine phosphatase